MSSSPAAREAWILGGALDGAAAAPPLIEIAGLPLLLRHAAEAAAAGVERIYVVWFGDAPPDIAAVAADDRLARTAVDLSTTIPTPVSERVLVIRADRVFHRDMCKRVVAGGTAEIVKISGGEHDGVFATSALVAADLAEAAPRAGGIAEVLERAAARGSLAQVPAPYRGFTVPAPTSEADRASRRRAEKLLCASLRKAADGYAARLVNRRISIPLTRLLARTSVHPNHVTILCLLCALAGGAVLSCGGYWAGVAGMLLVELGSILDGVDGELARLKLRFSRAGQWMDTVTDDLANVSLAMGAALNLDHAGTGWALPVLGAGVAAFAITQASQYYLIATVYHSGDLAAIPWAFQSTAFLESRPRGLVPRLKAGIPKLLKRDFTVTLFVVLAIAGFLEGVLLLFAGGAIAFLVAYSIQYVRTRRAR